MSPVTLVLIGVGIPESGLLGEAVKDPRTGQWLMPEPREGSAWADHAATQTRRRFDLVHLGPFRYETPEDIRAFTNRRAGIEQHLRLFLATPGMLTSGRMPEYLFRRTGGIVGLLERLIEDGCERAVDTGAERLDVELLDQIDINLGNRPLRDPDAGEMPDIPPKSPSGHTSQGRRSRNTLFDDHGPACSTAG